MTTALSVRGVSHRVAVSSALLLILLFIECEIFTKENTLGAKGIVFANIFVEEANHWISSHKLDTKAYQRKYRYGLPLAKVSL